MIHKTKDGRQILISAMETSHLINCIRFAFKPYTLSENQILEYALGRTLDRMTPETFNRIIQAIHPYLLELIRRNQATVVVNILSQYSPLWKTTEKVSVSSLLLNSNSDDDNDDDDDDNY